ncbi:MAG: N-acetyltransferase [Erysipelotrichia bacterium]|nr:N-acetyltransferase [Erysipelotrichia bacterium]NCC54798.1 N-acetyltransferase [Erysipelotrichia bacterium]
MKDVYEICPQFENEQYQLRYVKNEDCDGLLKVYADKKAVVLMNSDNCHGDDFYYANKEEMQKAISFWHFEYEQKGFVRWAIIEKVKGEVIGTIELFHRDANDYFTHCGLLRLDVRSDYEIADKISCILSLILQKAFVLFECDKIAIKAIPKAKERRKALHKLGFVESDEVLIGHDGTKYTHYFVLKK